MNRNTNQPVSKVIHIEIGFQLNKINQWAKAGFEDPLTNKGRFEYAETKTVYQIDVLPHPNGEDSVFYHRHTNSFSAYMGAEVYLGKKALEGLRELEESAYGFEWNIYKDSISVTVLAKEERRVLIIVPTYELHQIQRGHSLLNNQTISCNNQNIAIKGETIDLPVSKTETERINREILGIRGVGVRYSNALCFIGAYPSNEYMTYTEYNKK